MAQDDPPDLQVECWLKTLGIESLCQWDMLVFLYRHQSSLVNPEQFARILGYATAEVVAALDSLESSGLVGRSRVSQGVRLYQLTAPADRRQTASDRRQTASDHRQTASDRRQTASDRRQTASDPARRDALERLMTLADSHTVRLLLARKLQGSG